MRVLCGPRGRMANKQMNKNLIITFNVNGYMINVGDGCDFYTVDDLLDAIINAEYYENGLDSDEINDIESLFENGCPSITCNSEIINDDLITIYLTGLDFDEYEEALEKLDNFLDFDNKIIEFLVENFEDLDEMIEKASDIIDLFDKYDDDVINTIIECQGVEWLIDNQDDFYVYDGKTGPEIAEDYVYECYHELENQRLVCGCVMGYLDFDAIWRDMRICGSWVEYDSGWIEFIE